MLRLFNIFKGVSNSNNARWGSLHTHNQAKDVSETRKPAVLTEKMLLEIKEVCEAQEFSAVCAAHTAKSDTAKSQHQEISGKDLEESLRFAADLRKYSSVY